MKQLDFDTKRVSADYKLDLGFENISSFVFPQLMEPCMSSGGRHMNQYKYDSIQLKSDGPNFYKFQRWVSIADVLQKT